uniref:TIGR03752 family integrating conjugative element protein n=1 Tax=Azotobacter vinelandii TaxID=354 RepID=UPI0007733409
MALKSNGLLKILVPGVLIGVVLILVTFRGGDEVPAPASGTGTEKKAEDLQLTQEELRLLGVEGDTPQDTVATLVGRVRAMQKQLDSSLSESEKLREQNAQLAERNTHVDGRIAEALREERQRLDSSFAQREKSLLNQFEQKLGKLQDNYDNTLGTGTGGTGTADVPVGFGLEGAGVEGLTWVAPLDGQLKKGSPTGKTFPRTFGEPGKDGVSLDTKAAGLAKAAAEKVDKVKDKPFYTLPANSTLMGSLGMTALIGRVPVDGTVNDPYPFKVVIGKKNLTANHIQLPDVQAAVVSGTASGDWTLSCVRGTIESLTFVFEDGRIRTVPEVKVPTQGGQRQNRSSSNTNNGSGQYDYHTGLGYISDPYGIPCVRGERRSNAKQYIGTQSLITAAGAGVATLLDADDSSSTVFSSGGTTFGSTSGSGNSALNNILSEGVSDIRSWVNKLYGEAFAAVYVPPGRRVAVNIDVPIEIDYEPDGRKVRYEQAAGVAYELP